MLQQILRDMYVDPELLAELDETQKQTLFCKMREEQVRRWRIWDQKVSKEEREGRTNYRSKNGTQKSVQFLQGEDGEPWVWVMGEHQHDKSIETILLEEARQAAHDMALEEAHQLRKSVERELTQFIDFEPRPDCNETLDMDISPKQEEVESEMELYCSADSLRQHVEAMRTERDNNERNSHHLHFHFIEGKRDSMQELGLGSGGCDGVSKRVAAWERRVAAARAGEILRSMRQRRARQVRDAEQLAHHDDLTWREQERKAKEAEQQIREIARAAREEHRRTSVLLSDHDTKDTFMSHISVGRPPPSREAVAEWFRAREWSRGAARDDCGQPAEWFHGLITRSDAENILSERPAGSFLVRLSEKIWGYAISYRGTDRCKHYLVDATNYQFLGDNQTKHTSLAELVRYHKTRPITESGGELLLQPCVAEHPPAIVFD